VLKKGSGGWGVGDFGEKSGKASEAALRKGGTPLGKGRSSTEDFAGQVEFW